MTTNETTPAPRPTRSLAASANPNKRMQELLSAKTPTTPDAASVDTELRKSVDTDLRTYVSTDAPKQALEEGSTDGREEARTRVPKQGRADAPTDFPAQADFLERVRTEIAAKPTPPGGVKATVDMSPDLSLRLKRYSLDHAGIPSRVVAILLLEAFLAEEGY